MQFSNISKNLVGVELNYMVRKEEFLVAVDAINKLRYHITIYHVDIHTHHSAIKYVMNKSDVKARIIGWILLL